MDGHAPGEKMAALVCETKRLQVQALLAVLARLGVSYVERQQGRTVQLLEPRPLRWLPLSRPAQLLDSPTEIFRAIAPVSQARMVAHELLANAPGKECACTALRIEEFALIHAGSPAGVPDAAPSVGKPAATELPEGMIPGLTRMVIIVPRGQGNTVARVVLDHGLCVPVVTFGLGSGIRDRLGLLRITIPPEKEIVSLTVPAGDAEMIVTMLTGLLHIDHPGRGFVYGHSIHSAMLNMRMRVGHQRHAATVEQIVDAIDSLHGGTGWRRRVVDDRLARPSAGRFRHDMDRVELVCSEEHSRRFLDVAIGAGAGGVTSCRSQMVLALDGKTETPYAITRSSLVLPHDHVPGVIQAMTTAGLFQTGGRLEQSQCPFVVSSRK